MRAVDRSLERTTSGFRRPHGPRISERGGSRLIAPVLSVRRRRGHRVSASSASLSIESDAQSREGALATGMSANRSRRFGVPRRAVDTGSQCADRRPRTGMSARLGGGLATIPGNERPDRQHPHKGRDEQ